VKMVGTLGAALAFAWLAAASAQAQTTTTPQDTTTGVEDSSQVQGQDAMTQQPQSQSGSDSIELSAVHGEQARQLQQKLKEQGLYNGRIDGILGPQTKRALQQFQQKQGIQGNGSLDQQTAEALGLNFDEIQRVRGTEKGGVQQQVPQSGSGVEGQDQQQQQQQSGQDVEQQSGDVMPQPATSPTQSGEQGSEEIDAQSGDLEHGDTATQPQSGSELEQGTTDEQSGSLGNDEQLDPQSGTLGEEHGAGTQSQSGTDVGAGSDTQTQSGAELGTDETQTQSGSEAGDNATGSGSMNTGADEEGGMTGGATTGQDPQSGSIGGEQSADVQMQAGMNVSSDQIRKVQSALKERGYFTGTASGKLDDETKNAIRKFQRAQGIPETGNLDAQTAQGLGVKLDNQQQITPQSGSEQQQQQQGSQTGSGSDIESQSGADVENETDNQTDSGIENQSGSGIENQSGTGGATTGEGIDEQSGIEGDTQQDAQDVQPDTDEQSGMDDVNEDTTSPVTGGATTTDETEVTSGQNGMGNESLGGVESQENQTGVVDSTEIDPQAGTQTTFDKKTIKKVEKALQERQVFTGKPDGVLDQETTDAIRQFQQQQGLTVTGQLDDQTIQALGVKVNDKKHHQRGHDQMNRNQNQDPNQGQNQNQDTQGGDDAGSTLPR